MIEDVIALLKQKKRGAYKALVKFYQPRVGSYDVAAALEIIQHDLQDLYQAEDIKLQYNSFRMQFRKLNPTTAVRHKKKDVNCVLPSNKQFLKKENGTLKNSENKYANLTVEELVEQGIFLNASELQQKKKWLL